ncbi:MAG: translocation/assembly module TamB domain-containing protein [Acidobacteria bacterium]|nr:translocation/assembly module TamB domain-containing protein [Acidobacteriota bacterium]
MSEENDNQAVETEENGTPENGAGEAAPAAPRRRRFFTRRRAGLAAGLLALTVVVGAILIAVFYRYGVFDNYIRAQFVAKMDRIGITFTADTFRVTVAPLKLELKNATFNDKLTGEKLFFIRNAEIGLTVQNLYSWQLSRDITVDSTDVDGAEVWVKFDENGKSNFSNLQFVEEQNRINFNYSSIRFNLKDGLVHYGDVERRLGGDAKNVVLAIGPEDLAVPDDEKRYKFDLNSKDSNFVYDRSRLENIDLRVQGITDAKGADITGLQLTTPIGQSNLKGRIDGWESPKYKFELESTVDLTQTSSVFPLGTPLRGIGNFKGTVSGEGEKYRVAGEISSESLAASNIYLKTLNVNATVDGSGSMYEANGKAIAQLLTFEDFKIDYPQLVGLIRGTGTDFKWFGELQAAAAKTPFGTIGRVFIADAVAEYKEDKFTAAFGRARTPVFSSKGFDIENLDASNGRLDIKDGVTNLSVPSAQAGKFKTKAFELDGVKTQNLKLKDVPKRTDIEIEKVSSDAAAIKDTKFKNLTAERARVGYENGTTTFLADTMRAAAVDLDDVRLGEVFAYNFNVRDVPSETIVAADNLKVAKVESSAAVLGTLNIAGVRLTVREGRIEGTSGDIDAGTVTLAKNSTLPDGGKLENVKINKPVFVLEPAGGYRVSADMSLGGGALGSVNLGAARAAVVVDNDRVALNNLTADVMDGKLSGNAAIAFESRNRSEINVDFAGLNLGKLLALQGGRVVPVEGQTTGNANLTFAGTNFKTATGSLTADIAANAGTAERGLIPVTGRIEANATNGLFSLDVARLNTEKSEFAATGSFDLNGYNSNLDLALDSTDAKEIERIVKVLGVSPDFDRKVEEYKAEFAGNLTFKGRLTGNVSDPTIDGRAALDSLILRGRELGSVQTDLLVSPTGTQLKNGLLREADGGTLAFDVDVPRGGTNNIAVKATLTNINTGNLLAALPVNLPESLRGLQANTSGTIDVSGLPDAMQGTANLTATGGSLRGQTFDNLDTRVTFAGNSVNVEKFDATFGAGRLTATGNYRTDTTAFDFTAEGKNIPFARIQPFITTSDKFPDVGGSVDLTARATGRTADSRSYEINFNGRGTDVTLNGNPLGEVVFSGKTENQQLNANLTANLEGQQQTIAANINFADPNLPFRAETNFNNTELAPFIALIPRQTGNVGVTGQATGRIFLEGDLMSPNAAGEREFTTGNLKGSANFSQLALQIGDTPIAATEPVAIRFDSTQVVVDNAKFAGAGSNLTISGTKALTANGINNLNVDGQINLSILNAVSPNAFFAGLADVNVRVTGPNQTARLNGTAEMRNASASAFIGTERISFERLKGRIIFTSNQAQIDELTGFLGGGKFTASGGAFLNDNLQLSAFRLGLRGENVTVPLPKNFLTTGDAEVEINGRREGQKLSTFIAGRINAKRSLYSRDIDLADVIGGRREGSISQSGGSSSSLGDINLDLLVEGRNALVVRNNLADLTASLSLRVTGDLDVPQVEGRITADRGTLFYRNDRYEVQRGELVFPPNTGGIEPVVNLQAESEINGYQIFVSLNGKLTDTENLAANVRSNPALPQPDVISLITTGSLTNTEGGISTLAQSGINTAAEILTDQIINKPIAKATDKLFGLNKFQLDPIISGQRLNPTARLTVGRQINRNLLVTYSTNLSEDQNQVLALEYRVSNRLSFVAQYEQRPLNNVTRNKDVFSFEIRLRKRF